MKLTSLGRDYHFAILLLVVSGVATSQGLFVGLGLALAVTSFISLLSLRLRSKSGVRVRADGWAAKVFKNDTTKIELSITGPADNWIALSVDSAKFDGPINVDAVHFEGNILALNLTPLAAGRYRGLVLGMRVRDPLNLFTQLLLETRAEVVIDSLPRSLLSQIRSPVLSPLVLGESPAGRPGRGQEFYGVEEYSYGSESRDILWKRAARRPESPLQVKVRESNIPGTTTIRVRRGEGQGSVAFTDLLCEALGTIGRGFLAMGVDVFLVAPGGRKIAVSEDGELADAIMAISTEEETMEGSQETAQADVCVIVGVEGEGRTELDSRPSVVIGDYPGMPRGRFVFPYTGVEDLAEVIGLVMTR